MSNEIQLHFKGRHHYKRKTINFQFKPSGSGYNMAAQTVLYFHHLIGFVDPDWQYCKTFFHWSL